MKNKTVLVIILALCYSTALFSQNKNENIRINQLFNFGWKFKYGENPEAVNSTFDDGEWRKLDLPHDYQIELLWDKTANRGRGFKTLCAG